MIRIKSVLLCSALAAVFVSGSSLQADLVSFSTPIPGSDAGGEYSLPTTASFSLPEFNPALGTLTGVEVTFALTYAGEIDTINFSQFFGPAVDEPFTSASSTVPVDVTTPSSGDTFLENAVYDLASGIAPGGIYPGHTPFMGPPTAMSPTFNPAMADFGLYTGLGSNTYTISYGTGTYLGSGTDVAFGGDASSSGTATVTYTYTPEPSSVVLLGLGAIALAAIARRKTRTQTT